jgi:hypothetical protein
MRFVLLMCALGLPLVASPASGGGPQPATPPPGAASLEHRVAELERQLADLRKELDDLRRHPQRRAAADDEKAERPVAWGKATSGLQAGLALRPADKRSFRVGGRRPGSS